MGLEYQNLDSITRGWMQEESLQGGHHQSPRLTAVGLAAWPGLLDRAFAEHNDDWLCNQLMQLGYMRHEELYTRNGVPRKRAVNIPSSAQMLAEGEFNRFYVRGLCRRAIDEGIPTLTVYRAKFVAHPRPESEAKIGTQVPVDELLNHLRRQDFVSVDSALAIPSGPNSGLSACLPATDRSSASRQAQLSRPPLIVR